MTRHDLPTWGDDPRPAVLQWRYWAFLVGWTCTVALVVHLALRGRGL